MNKVFIVVEDINNYTLRNNLFVADDFNDVINELHDNYVLHDYDVRDLKDFNLCAYIKRRCDGEIVTIEIEIVDYLKSKSWE